MKIAFTTELPREGFQRLVERGLGDWSLVKPHPTSAYRGGEEMEEWQEAEILVSTFDYRVPREMMEAMPNLRLIANFGAGYNNIDLSACRERGIIVTNTPQPVVEPTAELAFALMIDVARRVSEFDREIRKGLSNPPRNGDELCYPIPFGVMRHLSHSLYGKTLGIIGMGRIGQSLARRAIASGMRVIYHNRKPVEVPRDKVPSTKDWRAEVIEVPRDKVPSTKDWRAEVIRQAEYVDFQTILQDSDYLSLNLPYTPEVHHIIGKPELGMMKRSAYLINTARGAHVDEKALVEALQNGIIAGAALDVYENEPAIHPELLRLPNVVLSPHTGTGTWEGRIAMCENVCDNILAYLDGRTKEMDIVTN